MTKQKHELLAEQGWRAFGKHFRKCPTCQQRNREGVGPRQLCSIGRQLFLSEALTDEDRERLEFQVKAYTWSTSWGRFWRKVDGAREWILAIAGIGILMACVWVLAEASGHVDVRVDHRWSGYRVWKYYWAWWPVTVSFTVATILALVPDQKSGSTRGQRLFTSNSAVGGFWLFLFGIFWTVEKLGPWLGIPVFLVVFVSATLAWVRLDARFGYLNRPGMSSKP
jgi:hypothetical protein